MIAEDTVEQMRGNALGIETEHAHIDVLAEAIIEAIDSTPPKIDAINTFTIGIMRALEIAKQQNGILLQVAQDALNPPANRKVGA